MKIWVVSCEYGYNFDEMENAYIVGTYSNLGLAARAALGCFYTQSDKPIDRITNIHGDFGDVVFNIYGVDKDDNYTNVIIERTTLDDRL